MKKQFFIILFLFILNLNSEIRLNKKRNSLEIISENIEFKKNDKQESEYQEELYESFSSKSKIFKKQTLKRPSSKNNHFFNSADKCLEFIKKINKNKILKSLSIINSKSIIKQILNKLAIELKDGNPLDSVEKLELRANNLTTKNIIPLIYSLNNTNLKSLSLECNNIDENGIKLIFTKMKANNKLEKLLLGSNTERIYFDLYCLNANLFIQEMIAMLNKNKTLKYISLSFLGIDDDIIEYVSKNLKNNILEKFNFRANNIFNKANLINLLSNNPKLEILIDKNDLSEDDVETLINKYPKRIKL